MNLVEIKIEIAARDAESADEVLIEEGLESWSVLQDVIANRAWLVGIFENEVVAQESLKALAEKRPGEIVGGVEQRVLGDADWRDSYKAHFHAWQFGRLHWVPVWERERFTLPPGDAVLWLDPGMAFGTGNHETTRLCVERLVKRAAQSGGGGRVIDAGCGSGILALSAAKLGYRNVVAFDNDPEAVRVSRENAALNGLEKEVSFFEGDLITGFEGRQGDVVMANILGDVLIRFSNELTAAVAPGGVLILSGILASEVQQVRAEFSALAPAWSVDSRTWGEWSDVVLIKPS